jgi:bla regulator protein blaR1
MLTALTNHLWQSTLFVLVVALLALLLRNNSARVRFWLWMVASLKFLVPFAPLIALGGQLARQPAAELAFPPSAPQWSEVAVAMLQPLIQPVATPVVSAVAVESVWQVKTVASIVWGVGVLALLALWLYRWVGVRATLRAAQPAQCLLAGSFPVPIVVVAAAIEPAVVGIWRPVLLVPQGLSERLSAQQWQAILAHERCHLHRRDNLTAALHMLVEALFWFHPLVWWIGARLVEEREHACDAAVLGAGSDPECYASGILDVCQHYIAAPNCAAGVSGADLKKRVRSIMTFRVAPRLHVAKQTILAVTALLLLLAPVAVGVLTAGKTQAQGTQAASVSEDPAKWPAFASASIAVSELDNPASYSLLTDPSGVFTTRNFTLRGLIGFAYGLQAVEILARNAQATDLMVTRYNIVARTAEPLAPGRAGQRQFQLMVRRLLAERFQLAFHFEEQVQPVYAMNLDPNKHAIKSAVDSDPGPSLMRGPNSITGYATPMLLFKQFLASQLQRPLLDQTGLDGTYNFNLKWGPEALEPGAPPDGAPLQNPTPAALLEALRTQLGLTLISQDGTVRRFAVDRVRQATDLEPPRVAIAVDASVFDRYVGYYDLPPDLITVSRDGDRLLGKLLGQPPIQLFAEGGHRYFAKELDSKIQFVVGASGTATAVVLRQRGQELQAPRLEAAVAEQRITALRARIRDRIAAPGSEAALRDYLESIPLDQPHYERMSAEVAGLVRVQWPAARQRAARIGALQSIQLLGVTPYGADIYRAEFANGRSEWRISVDESGRIDRLSYRQLAQ